MTANLCQKCNRHTLDNMVKVTWCQAMTCICIFCFEDLIQCDQCVMTYPKEMIFIEDAGLPCECGGEFIIKKTIKGKTL